MIYPHRHGRACTIILRDLPFLAQFGTPLKQSARVADRGDIATKSRISAQQTPVAPVGRPEMGILLREVA
jgi:hypothetical protein